MSEIRIAVLMTCHNRREKTLSCLEALRSRQGVQDAALQLYLVDDGCTDGTKQAVLARDPRAIVLDGGGNLYWCGGMCFAFAEAMKGRFDYYLWLNDDTMLKPLAMATLIETARSLRACGHERNIVVGTVADPRTGKFTYGGVVRSSKWHPFHYRLVQPGDEPRPCETMNGNCVLISRQAAQAVGNMDRRFIHAFGDYDYGLRALRAGCAIRVAPGCVGTCARDHSRLKWRDASVPRRERWAYLMSVKGLPPRQMLLYCRRYGGPFWPVFWTVPYLRALLFPVRQVHQ